MLNVLRFCRELQAGDAARLLVVPAGIGSDGYIGEMDLRSPGEPVETWLARRRDELGIVSLPAGR